MLGRLSSFSTIFDQIEVAGPLRNAEIMESALTIKQKNCLP